MAEARRRSPGSPPPGGRGKTSPSGSPGDDVESGGRSDAVRNPREYGAWFHRVYDIQDVRFANSYRLCNGTLREKYNFLENPCFVVPCNSRVRVLLVKLVDHPWFDRVVLIFVILNVLQQLCDIPSLQDREWAVAVTKYGDPAFLIIFCIELLLKVLAQGLVLHEYSYLRDAWNVADFIIVLSGLVSLFYGSNLNILRLVRLLRPLRAVRRVRGMRVLVNTIVSAIPMMLDVLTLLFLVMYVFAVLGVQMWRGTLHQRCYITETVVNSNITAPGGGPAIETRRFISPDDPALCGARDCRNTTQYPAPECLADTSIYEETIYNFDYIHTALLTVMKVVTLDDWPDQLSQIQDASSSSAWIYFVLLTLIGGYFCLNLVLAILAVVYKETQRARMGVVEPMVLPRHELPVALTPSEEGAINERVSRWRRYIEEVNRQEGRNVFQTVVHKLSAKQMLKRAFGGATAKVRDDMEIMRQEEAGDNVEDEEHVRYVPGEFSCMSFLGLMLMHTAGAVAVPQPLLPVQDDLVSEISDTLELISSSGSRDADSDSSFYSSTRVSVYSSADGEGGGTKKPPICWCIRKPILVVVESKPFSYTMLGITFVNVAVMAADHHGASDRYRAVSDNTSIIASWCFLLEMLFKMVGLGLPVYFRDGYNIMDCVLVLSSLPEMFALGGVDLTALVAFRAFRGFRLMVRIPPLRQTVTGIANAFVAVLWLLVLLFLLTFIYAMLGLNLFQTTYAEDDRENFRSLWEALITVFVVITGDGWGTLMKKAMDGSSFAACAYFLTLFSFGNLILTNLFIAILIDRFHVDPVGEKDDRVYNPEGGPPGSQKRRGSIAKAVAAASMRGGCRTALGGTKSRSRSGSMSLGSRRDSVVSFSSPSSPPPAHPLKDELDRQETLKWRRIWGNGWRASFSDRHQRPFWWNPEVGRTWVSPLSAVNNHRLNPKEQQELQRQLDIFAQEGAPGVNSALPATGPPTLPIGGKLGSTHDNANNAIAGEDNGVKSTKFAGVGTPDNKHEPVLADMEGDAIFDAVPPIRTDRIVVEGATANGLTLCPYRPSQWHLKMLMHSTLKNALAAEDAGNLRLFELCATERTAQYLKQIWRMGGQNKRMFLQTLGDAGVLCPSPVPPAEVSPTLREHASRQAPYGDLSPQGTAGSSTMNLTDDFDKLPASSKIDIRLSGCAPKALGVFTRGNAVRRWLAGIVLHDRFEPCVVGVIFINAVFLALDDYYAEDRPGGRVLLEWANFVFTFVYVLEMIAKIIVMGFIGVGVEAQEDGEPSAGYLRETWNRIDFFVVVSMILEMWGVPYIINLRCMRTLRILIRVEALKVVVMALLKAAPQIVYICLVCLFVWLVFGILGVQLFKGKYYRCSDESFLDPVECLTKLDPSTGRPRRWVNADVHFDHLGMAALALFEVSVVEGWATIMWNGVDGRSYGSAPEKNAHPQLTIFFVGFVIVGNFFCVNLFIGTLINRFNSDMETLLTRSQAKDAAYNRLMQLYSLPWVPIRPTSWLRRRCYDAMHHKYFEPAVLIAILLNCALLGTEHHEQTSTWERVLVIGDYFFVFLFTLEMIVKQLAIGLLGYFREPWNRFDCVCVFAALIGIVFSTVNAGAFRLLRVFRAFRLLKKARGLELLFHTMLRSLPSLGNIVLLLFYIWFNWGVVGVSMFKNLADNPTLGQHNNFRTLPNAVLVLYQIGTTEAWTDVMEGTYLQPPECDPNIPGNCGREVGRWAYFVSYMIIGSFIVMNLFVFVVLNNFENDRIDVQSHNSETQRGEMHRGFSILRDTWEKECQNVRKTDRLTGGTNRLDVDTLVALVQTIPEPVWRRPARVFLRTPTASKWLNLIRNIKSLPLRIPLYRPRRLNGQFQVEYDDVLRSLAMRVIGMKESELYGTSGESLLKDIYQWTGGQDRDKFDLLELLAARRVVNIWRSPYRCEKIAEKKRKEVRALQAVAKGGGASPSLRESDATAAYVAAQRTAPVCVPTASSNEMNSSATDEVQRTTAGWTAAGDGVPSPAGHGGPTAITAAPPTAVSTPSPVRVAASPRRRRWVKRMAAVAKAKRGGGKRVRSEDATARDGAPRDHTPGEGVGVEMDVLGNGGGGLGDGGTPCSPDPLLGATPAAAARAMPQGGGMDAHTAGPAVAGKKTRKRVVRIAKPKTKPHQGARGARLPESKLAGPPGTQSLGSPTTGSPTGVVPYPPGPFDEQVDAWFLRGAA